MNQFLRLSMAVAFLTIECYLGADILLPANNLITVEQKNVLHNPIQTDPKTDHPTQKVFSCWSNETFNVFNRVKDPNGIAIDLGASITAIWLSKNFHHVVTVDKDVARSVTFKQLVYDTVYADEKLDSHKISFIKCDLEGAEEEILEDVLHFAFYNKCPVYISFHLDWWVSKKISDFDYLFKYFNVTNVTTDNISEFIQENPFASLLFEPRQDVGELVKKNVTAVIIGYNQATYIKNMVSQLEKYTKDIVIIDNHSDYQPLLDYYQNDFKYSLLRQKANYGHTVYHRGWVKNITGDIFILTDPDLQFNPNLPSDCIQQLIDVSQTYQANKVGFALLIDADDIRSELTFFGMPLKEWESRFWQNKIDDPKNGLELYWADIDTTFCLVNRKYPNKNIRVAGNYTCIHIPWHMNFQKNLLQDEYESYLNNNVSSNYFKVETQQSFPSEEPVESNL